MQIPSLFSLAREDTGENECAVYLHKEGFVLSSSLPFLSSLVETRDDSLARLPENY